ncbi:kinesin light chain [Aspergillus steynii IBT 23096]|uniref:Kinesin light chain n=1 Tax=Aspergillus steynii IBT 23096 TaxID=1392250 RepID=A0A2I2G7A7_9EURO|nr:kinesin light chain [Aspergillus steynii IBT 23096]PLB48766.1 kinesin light chain [Aspergillus steynii IBT 23096]
MARCLSHQDYTVGWVCALPDELTAAQEVLDEEHQDLPPSYNDSNIYTLGSIGAHNVVLACLPAGQTGTNSAAAVAIQMKNTFPAIRFGLMVGIGGGVPSKEADIRLGDIVVSQPGNSHGGVVQYDFGKSTPSGFERTGFLNTPPTILLAAVTKLRSNLDRGRSSLSPHLSKLGNLPKFGRTQAGSDILFEAECNHGGEDSCRSCTAGRRMQRKERANNTPMIHYGTIASGNQVMRDGVERDKISFEFGGVLCFEMEAAGLMNNFPCLVIRGICDYSDSHKNKRWQPYAAGTAAAYAKELLGVIPAADIVNTRTVDDALRETKRTFYLPLQRNHKFVGRSAELNTLKQKLLVWKDCQKATLSGLGGIGKTQVALQFAYSVKADCPEFSIFWVQSLSMETFELSCSEVAKILGIRQAQENSEDVKILLRQHLSAKSAGKWLLIVDNADDLDLLRGTHQTEGLLSFLPESNDGLTMFTTRHGAVAQYLTGSDVVEIGKMATYETRDLLEKSLIRKDLADDSESVKTLLTELEYLPLAITQAAAYINANKSSISEYLRLLKKTEQDAVTLISTDFGDTTRYRNLPNAIAKTWSITFNGILEWDRLAADLLAFMSCIEWRAIPYSILPTADPEARLAGAIGTLCSYSFLERRDDGTTLDMHRLVHLATRVWVNQKRCEIDTRMEALKHLLKVFPSDDYTNREIWRAYLPHVAHIERDKQCKDTEEMSKLCLKVGRCLYVDGRMQEAVLWLRESCEWRDSNLTQDSADRLVSKHELAGAYRANGQIKEAVKLLEHHVITIESKVLAEDHPSRLASQHVLAGVYQANRQIKEAVKLLEHIVAIESKVLTEDHPDQLALQHELAGAYRVNGQIKEAAVKLLEHVVAIESKVLAEDHPDQLASQHELVGVYQANGQIKEAVKLLEHVITIKSKVLAEDHPSRLVSERALATFYKDPMTSASKTPQAMSDNNTTSTALSDQSPAEQERKSSYTSKRRLFMRQLKGILKAGAD